jgi:hypothetical protein
MTFVWIGVGAFVAFVYLLAVCLCMTTRRADAAIERMMRPITLRYDVWEPTPFRDPPVHRVKSRFRQTYEGNGR